MAEVTIESLQARIADLEASTKKSADQYQALEKEKAEAEKQIAELQEVIKALQAQIKEQEALLPVQVEVKVGKATYIVTGPVRTKDGVFSIEDIAKNSELCEYLIEIGSTILVKKS